jgi:hypothetical protein
MSHYQPTQREVEDFIEKYKRDWKLVEVLKFLLRLMRAF